MRSDLLHVGEEGCAWQTALCGAGCVTWCCWPGSIAVPMILNCSISTLLSGVGLFADGAIAAKRCVKEASTSPPEEEIAYLIGLAPRNQSMS